MKNIKKVIVLLIAIFVIIIGIIWYLTTQYKAYEKYGIDEQPMESTYVYDSTIKNVSVRNEYYSVKSCINKFYTYYKAIYTNINESSITDAEILESLQKQKVKYVQAVYNMLDEEYIKYYNLTEDNLKEHLNELGKMSMNITEMYISEHDRNINVYFANGYFINTATSQTYDFSIMVKQDAHNETFTVLLEDYIKEKYGEIETGKNIEIYYPESIEDNGYNTYDYEIVDNETYITDVFKSLKNNLIYNRQIAYENLDEDYKEKRFSTFEEFEEYIKNNIRKISVMSLDKYERNNNNGDITYTCIDTNGNYYIFEEVTTMNCKVILDTYTMDLPDFAEKYEQSDNATKVALNIEKVKEAINSNDFKYVYDKTNYTFKNNNFKDLTEFENYIKSNLFEENEFEYKNIEQQADVYVANVIVSNKKDSTASTKQMQVIMKITNNTTWYSISFNFGE